MEFSSRKLQPIITDMLFHATTQLPADVLDAIKAAHVHESRDIAKKQLEAILNSVSLSDERKIPVCQDTGLVTLFVSGDLVKHLDAVEKALTRAIESLTEKGGMRANVVHPFTRKNTITNTGLGQPEVLIDRTNRRTAMKLLLKGAGSENFTNLKMMNPTVSRQEVVKHVLQVVVEAGGKTCPPNILGIGIGGSAVQAIVNSKLALLRPVGERNPDSEIAHFENSLLTAVNRLEIGTMGLGGDTTVLDVHVESAGTHTACLPVAVSFGCWANRAASAELWGKKFRIVR